MHGGVKHQSINMLSFFKTDIDDNTSFHITRTVHKTPVETFTCPSLTEEQDLKAIEDLEFTSVRVKSEIWHRCSITDDEKF